ncbi:MAG TPA: glycosyltransferase family 4 protein [Actinomycetota bacterium]|nr:glycosyltransferase family 4 protein [Actinomycetota bacterium]
MRLAVLTPHFEPDTAPTGAVVTRLTEELAARGHRIEVVTSLPWYRDHRVEPAYRGRLTRIEDTPWGRITRIHPFPTSDKTDIVRRAASFVAFSALAALKGRADEGLDEGLDAVLAVSPPLTLGIAAGTIARARDAAFVFNIQDVFPDVVIELGYLKNPLLIEAARRLERRCYATADAVTVLSEDLRDNVVRKIGDPSKVRVIPNFADTDLITPVDRENAYRERHGLTGRTVVMYAGNIGLSQSLDLMIAAASSCVDDDDLVFVLNGAGAARTRLEETARGLGNVRFVDPQPVEALPEVLGAADIHVVPLKRGLSRASVPSKTFSILAAGRPFVASVDPGSEIAAIAERSGAGIAVPPEDPVAFVDAIKQLRDHPANARAKGAAGRRFIASWASPAAVAESYERLFAELRARARERPA